MDEDVPKLKERSSRAPSGVHTRIRSASASFIAREKEGEDWKEKEPEMEVKESDVRIDIGIAKKDAQEAVELAKAAVLKSQAQIDMDNSILATLFHRMFCASSIHYATALNILAVYMKGQKMIHIEAKEHHEFMLNCLMLPAIVNAAACTVLSSVLTGNSILLSSLTAFNSCVLALISYLKLDAKAEAHKSSAYQYDKLQSLCEFHAGKFLFFESEEESQRFYKIMTEIETKVKEIKDANQFVLPEAVRNKYPVIYTTNVFAEVKRLQNKESVECAKYIKMVEAKASSDMLHEQIEKIVNFKTSYLKLDEEFSNEMKTFSCLSFFKNCFDRNASEVREN